MSNNPPLFNFFLEISIMDQLVGTMLERVLPDGITRAQFGILNHFVRLEIDQKSPGELASTFQVTRSTMTSTLGRMQRNGLVTIDTDPADGRGKIVRLTSQGKKLREDCVLAIKPMIAHMAPKFPLDRMPSAMMVLREVRDILDANRAESSASDRKS
ncbi:MAG: MarR family transcriptional regulator [Sphingorhabdus sp.]